CVTELGDPQYIGTALTIQTCLGFLLTTISIELIPRVEALFGWRYAFAILAPGPLFGVISMMRLRGLPEAKKIAHGHRQRQKPDPSGRAALITHNSEVRGYRSR